MWAKLTAFWSSLPHYIQAAIVLVVGTALSSIGNEIIAPNACWTWACWKVYLLSGMKAGIIAVFTLYLKSSLYQLKG